MSTTTRLLRAAARWSARIGGGVLVLVLLGAGTVYGVSERRLRARVAVPEHPLAVPDDAAAVARGAHLATVRGCIGCHGEKLGGRVEIDDPFIGRLAGPNLTRGGRGAALSGRDWERAVRHGVRRDSLPLLIMPSHEHNGLADEDLGAIVAYARSLAADGGAPPPSRAGPGARALWVSGQINLLAAEEIDHRRPHPARMAPEPTARYGAYVGAMCTGCHGPNLSGGRIPGTPPDWKPAANLTRAGIGHYSEADFVRVLRTGRRPGGTTVDTLGMPVRMTRAMTDVEMKALYAYLRSVPAQPFGQR